VRDAFRAVGHDAYSCDLLAVPIGVDSCYHIQADVNMVLNYQQRVLGGHPMSGKAWDLMIAHPPCTFLCSSGLHRNKGDEARQQKTEDAIRFVRMLLDSPIQRICLENPIGRIGTAIRKAEQIIQPYQFGHDASKSTGLWLKNLPPLRPTQYIEPRIVNGKPRWANQTDSGQNRLAPSVDRWAKRSVTYAGIAEAMAGQWGNL
jgi:hypothetical protein